MSKKTLGKGLSALIGSVQTLNQTQPISPHATATIPEDVAVVAAGQTATLRYLPLDKIQRNPKQPRQVFESTALQELADSIKEKGVIQPIVVRPLNDGTYQIIAGERRWRAAQLAQLEVIPAIVREMDEFEMMALALIENVQREDLSSIEEAMALQQLAEQFQLTHEQVSKLVGKSRVAVTNTLRLLQLHPQVQEHLNKKNIDMGHARALLALPNAQQLSAAQHIMAHQLSVRETEAFVKKVTAPHSSSTASKKKSSSNIALDVNVKALLDDASLRLGAKIELQTTDKGRGKLLIDFHSFDELEGILGKF